MGMEGMKLCWKCREKWYGMWVSCKPPDEYSCWVHCHHPEPEEKPKEKCWCEEYHWLSISGWKMGMRDRETMTLTECPFCHRKMK
jgi:hypothetical protein